MTKRLRRNKIQVSPTPYQDKVLDLQSKRTTSPKATIISELINLVIKGELVFADGRNYFEVVLSEMGEYSKVDKETVLVALEKLNLKIDAIATRQKAFEDSYGYKPE